MLEVDLSSALITYGGWSGHQPEDFARFVEKHFASEGYDVVLSDSLDVFDDGE